MANMIVNAHIIARLAHRGQVDKGGNDYFNHCLAVSKIVAARTDFRWRFYVDAICAALLHDTVEDTPLSLHDLRDLGFSDECVKAVGFLTEDLTGQISHDDYLRRIRDADGNAGTIARIVKLADLEHNADPTRSYHMPPAKLAARYERSLRIMRGD